MAINTSTGMTGGFYTDNQTHWQYGYQPVTVSGPYITDPTIDQFPQLMEKYANVLKKEAQMEDNIVHEAMRKRREEQAAERIRWLDNEFLTLEAEDGTIVTWRVSFHDTPTKTYHYVALKGGAYWYVTGDSGKHTRDSLITKIVGLSMKGQVFFEDADDPL